MSYNYAECRAWQWLVTSVGYKLLNQKSNLGKNVSTKLIVTIFLKCIFNLVLHHTSYLPGKSILTLFISLPGETE